MAKIKKWNFLRAFTFFGRDFSIFNTCTGSQWKKTPCMKYNVFINRSLCWTDEKVHASAVFTKCTQSLFLLSRCQNARCAENPLLYDVSFQTLDTILTPIGVELVRGSNTSNIWSSCWQKVEKGSQGSLLIVEPSPPVARRCLCLAATSQSAWVGKATAFGLGIREATSTLLIQQMMLLRS